MERKIVKGMVGSLSHLRENPAEGCFFDVPVVAVTAEAKIQERRKSAWALTQSGKA